MDMIAKVNYTFFKFRFYNNWKKANGQDWEKGDDNLALHNVAS
jgi:hypothetical protein